MPKSDVRKKKTPTVKKKSGAPGSAPPEERPVDVMKPTRLYVPVATVAAILAGLTVIILNFLTILPRAPQPQYNVVGLVFMSLGFVLATQIK
jgi:hypothetical protein